MAEVKNEDETRPELIEFLKYVKDSIHTKPQTVQVKRISERVNQVEKDSMSEVRYIMMSLVHDNEMKYEGKLEGELVRLIKQTIKKVEKKMSVDEIAVVLEEEPEQIEKIVRVIKETRSRNPEGIYRCLVNSDKK